MPPSSKVQSILRFPDAVHWFISSSGWQFVSSSVHQFVNSQQCQLKFVSLSVCQFVGLLVCQFVAVCFGLFQFVAVCCSLLQFFLVCFSCFFGLLVCWFIGLSICPFVWFVQFVLVCFSLSVCKFANLWVSCCCWSVDQSARCKRASCSWVSWLVSWLVDFLVDGFVGWVFGCSLVPVFAFFFCAWMFGELFAFLCLFGHSVAWLVCLVTQWLSFSVGGERATKSARQKTVPKQKQKRKKMTNPTKLSWCKCSLKQWNKNRMGPTSNLWWTMVQLRMKLVCHCSEQSDIFSFNIFASKLRPSCQNKNNNKENNLFLIAIPKIIMKINPCDHSKLFVDNFATIGKRVSMSTWTCTSDTFWKVCLKSSQTGHTKSQIQIKIFHIDLPWSQKCHEQKGHEQQLSLDASAVSKRLPRKPLHLLCGDVIVGSIASVLWVACLHCSPLDVLKMDGLLPWKTLKDSTTPQLAWLAALSIFVEPTKMSVASATNIQCTPIEQNFCCQKLRHVCQRKTWNS